MYEAVIGLEVHAQLNTQSKAFCGDEVSFGEAANSKVSKISLGHPGTLPYLNRQAVDFAIKMGYACNCEINKYNEFSRKNYFYADLPKGYQISQFDTPICTNGKLNLNIDGDQKTIGITRIHLEEDAGKSMHDLDPYYSLIDLNRAGVPLIEIVSEPDLRTSDDAYAYLTEIRRLVRYLDICDGNMEEGNLRCDANISVRKRDTSQFGTKVEVKNMNSIRNVKRAIEFEIKRQIQEIESGGEIFEETRSFNALDGSTFSMRSKEQAHDYRFFPEPDLPPLVLTQAQLDQLKAEMPTLPAELLTRYTNEFGLSDYDAMVIIAEKETALWFNELCRLTADYKAAANWLIGPVKSYLNEHALGIDEFPLDQTDILGLIELIAKGKSNFTVCAQRIFPELIKNPSKDAFSLAQEMNLIQESDEGALNEIINEVLEAMPEDVARYKAGKKALIGMFMGQIMKRTKGKADPKATNQLLRKALDS